MRIVGVASLVTSSSSIVIPVLSTISIPIVRISIVTSFALNFMIIISSRNSVGRKGLMLKDGRTFILHKFKLFLIINKLNVRRLAPYDRVAANIW